MNKRVEDKLSQLPKTPGVYLYKDANNQIIYIGKASNLRSRVRQYFQNSRKKDTKTDILVGEIADIEWIEVETEIDALFLEAEIVRRYMPKYNVLLRDDKSYVYIRISYDLPHPTVTITRRPLDDGAKYFGPYSSATSIKKALKYLRKAFPYSTHNVVPKKVCLHYHLGLCPGLEENKTTLNDYRLNLRRLIRYIKGERVKIVLGLEREMIRLAKREDFELASLYRDKIRALKQLSMQVIFGDRELFDIQKDNALAELSNLLGLKDYPKTIEGFDISHMSGVDNTASMVVFSQGLPDKTKYRKFKMRVVGNDDFAHMREVTARRFSPKNISLWGKPDLVLVDGGKGQLGSALEVLGSLGLRIPIIGLAKREEEIVIHSQSNLKFDQKVAIAQGAFVTKSGEFSVVRLPKNSNAVKLLQRIRDESHRFAVSYHSVLKTKRQTKGALDSIPGIGPVARKKLLKTFGSVQGVAKATKAELQKTVGASKTRAIQQFLGPKSK